MLYIQIVDALAYLEADLRIFGQEVKVHQNKCDIGAKTKGAL